VTPIRRCSARRLLYDVIAGVDAGAPQKAVQLTVGIEVRANNAPENVVANERTWLATAFGR
jgi:hypothetical protein